MFLFVCCLVFVVVVVLFSFSSENETGTNTMGIILGSRDSSVVTVPDS